MNAVDLGVTVDCVDARAQARFWRLALGWDDAPPPAGWPTWAAFLTAMEVPAEEWDDGAAIVPPGPGPTISFLRVPEAKTVKNRVHLDVKVSGGRAVDPATREALIRAKQAELEAAGASTLREDGFDGQLDHLVMQDPEGNEFCIV